jgi:hypothetical protein
MKICLIFICAIFLLNCHAQKVDIDKITIPIRYTQFPNSSSLFQYKTYISRISEPLGLLETYGIQKGYLINKFLVFDGYQRVNTNYDFQVDVVLGDILIIENRLLTQTKKRSDGRISNTYQYIYKFNIPVALRILDKRGIIIYQNEVRKMNHIQEWNSDVYNAISDVDKFVKNRWKEIVNLQVTNFINSAIADIQAIFNKEFGLSETKDFFTFYKLDSEKHPEYNEFKIAFDKIKTAFERCHQGMNVAQLKAQVAPCIAYWKSLEAKLVKEDKQQFKLKKACIQNLMFTCFFSNDFESYGIYGNHLEALEPKSWSNDPRKRELQSVLDRMQSIQIGSLYYKRELPSNEYYTSQAVTNQSAKYEVIDSSTILKSDDISKIKKSPTDQVIKGNLLSVDDKSFEGYFLITTPNLEKLVFNGPVRNTYFMYAENNNYLTKDLNAKSIKTFMIDQRRFVSILHKSNEVLSKLQPEIAEVLYENENYNLYQYYPSNGDLQTSTMYEYFIVNNKTNEEAVLGKVEYFWKRRLKNFFELCQKSSEVIEKIKGFPSTNDLVKIIEIQSECKK